MILLHQADQRVPDHGRTPPPLTWDRAKPGALADDLALITCAAGHTLRLTSRIHRIATDGSVFPSWVCTVPGCAFHEFIRLVGWQS